MSGGGGSGLHVDATVARGDFSVTAAFDVAAGRVLALAGPVGSGATTLVRAIAGRLPLTAGVISIDGVIVSSVTAVVPREQRRVGAVFEGYRLPPRLMVRDIVASPFRRRGAPRAVARAAAQPWLERFEVDHLAAAHPAELTAGQRMRTALARALASDPAVLVLDDPLAPLDTAERTEARTELAGLLRDFGRPAVIATRDPVDLSMLADDVVMLRDTRVERMTG